ncbi:hypothetical protein HGA92_01490 [Candidatus Gracilibacteria bacterium]|nr:hypothetical protein [Candidatus Gracilibacteria bacterium]NUJ98718.1 hypothetical protein [Candidatus Gracilibacteria bacterium]
MKNIGKIFIVFIGICFLFITPLSFGASNEEYVEVEVTEEIPGMDCSGTMSGTTEKCSAGTENCTIKCKVPKGFNGILQIMGILIKYFTFFAGLGGVLYIVINGILLSMSGLEGSAKGEIKKRITQGLIGIILLLLSGVILNIVAPWIYK